MARVAVVGAGVSGLTAAYRLRQGLGGDATIDVYESSDRIGGVLNTHTVAGAAHDVGAEAFIVRRPEAVALVAELGLTDRVVAPSPRRPALWSAGGLPAIPAPTLMGIPASADSVRDVVGPAELAWIASEPDRGFAWTPGAEVAIGELVAARFGEEVVARSVDPLLGGCIPAAPTTSGSVRLWPALAARLDAGAPNLSAAVTELLPAPSSAPVFGALVGGYRVLLDALLAAAAPTLRSEHVVSSLHRSGAGWSLVDDEGLAAEYDGVILAMPPWIAAGLLGEVAPAAAVALGVTRGASSVVVSMAFAAGTLPEHSGVLVASDARAANGGLHAKALTLSSQKWPHLGGADQPVLVRASFGRFGAEVPSPTVDPGIDQRLLADALSDVDTVCAAVGLPAPSSALIDSDIQHWPHAIPVYGPGHLAAMTAAAAQLPPRISVAGPRMPGWGASLYRAGWPGGEAPAR